MVKQTKKALGAGSSVPFSMGLTWCINHFGKLQLDADGLLMLGAVVGAVVAYAAAYLPQGPKR